MPYGPSSGKITPYSCRACHKLQNEWSNIEIGQELLSEMSKEWYNHENIINMLKLKTSSNHSKSLILGSRDSFSSNFNIFKKNNSNCLMLQAITWKFLEMWPTSAWVNFFSFWHYILIDNHWIDHSYQFWPLNPYMRCATAHQRQVMCSQFRTKLLVTKILERCVLVATKVPYKSLLTLDPCHWSFMP